MADDKHSSAERGDGGSEHSDAGGPSPVRQHQHRPSSASSHTAAHDHDDDNNHDAKRPAKKRQDSNDSNATVETQNSEDGNSAPASVTAEEEEEENEDCVYNQGDDDDDDDDDGEDSDKSLRRRKKYCRLPLIKRPAKGDDGQWLHNSDKSTKYLGLLYNLAVGAALASFSGSGIKAPGEIPDYLAYFILISTMWCMQLHYALRFEANDDLHRVIKAGHILLYVYVGATSGGWDLSVLASDRGPSIEEEVAHDEAARSFISVAITIAVHRGLMAIQYLIVVIIGRKARRRITSPAITSCVMAISCGLGIAAAAIPAHTRGQGIAKIVLLFLGTFVELVNFGTQIVCHVLLPISGSALASEYGSLSLIILGAGFTNLATSFQTALGGLAESSSTYALVFLCIGIMYNIWVFLFAHFAIDDAVDSKAIWAWEVVHIPLHFVMLLLLFALANVVVTNSFIHGLKETAITLLSVFHRIFQETPVPPEVQRQLTYSLTKLDLQDEFEVQYQMLAAANVTDVGRATVLTYQYFARVLREASLSSDVSLSSATNGHLDAILDLNPINATASDDTVRAMAQDALEGVFSDALRSVLWLFPAAGLVLIFCAIRSMLRYRFAGIAEVLLHWALFVVGIAVALLGLLDLGSKSVTLLADGDTLKPVYHNALYRLVDVHCALVVIFVVYSILTLMTPVIMYFVARYKRKEEDDDDVSQRKDGRECIGPDGVGCEKPQEQRTEKRKNQ
ncbi:uncharacterized protein LOC62_03G003729 [Vanrija pseudolonga]|uniref:Uncharacterized protein n=1 Tax=Vanrija pseudolonga TaxID=143232 RepID=A0AAF1BGT9_9TREE|nr:hypothetical protein LOC62_03G003729 [Vanrija pseudolonga]